MAAITEVPAFFKLNDPHIRHDPYPAYAHLRETQPIARSSIPFLGSVWLVSRYDDVVSILKDPRISNEIRLKYNLFASRWSPRLFRVMQTTMLRSDGATHTRLRKLVQLAFTPKRVDELAARIEQLTHDLLDAVQRKSSIDLLANFALPLPLTVISELMGVPEVYHSRVRKAIARLEGIGSGKLRDIFGLLPAAGDMLACVKEIVEMRREHPEDDLISALVQAEEAGERLSEDELLAMITEMFTAGHESTGNLISLGALALMQHPDQLARLHQHPEFVESAVEELLRYTNPVEFGSMRFALEAITMHGITMPAGSTIIALLSSANRDASVFDNPDDLDITRTPNRHLAFGLGGHYCIGAPLARLEGQIALRALTQRFPEMRLAAASDSLKWKPLTVGFRGLHSLPVSLT
jgi:cytochrome P450